MPKVIVGMSGGVDSSVSAHILKERGYEVEGLSFILWEARTRTDFSTCCSMQAVHGAAETARKIGIPHNVRDVRGIFIEKVIEPFVGAYTGGLTPNPCILCNRYIKFPFLIQEADERGADFIATGHYARIERENARPATWLKKGTDAGKDQSYVLYALKKGELDRLLLPLGDYWKKDVRLLAGKLGLPSADRPESQEICFIEDRKYFNFIGRLSPSAAGPGPIIDEQGKVLGEHKGIYSYTIGQRKRLGISSPVPLYVMRIDVPGNTVYVGPRESAMIKELVVEELNWLAPGSFLREAGDAGLRAAVKIRSMMKDEPAVIFADQEYGVLNRVKVVFDRPQLPTAPGQSAVFYNKDVVIGGGVIAV